jgi:hypothetical protein
MSHVNPVRGDLDLSPPPDLLLLEKYKDFDPEQVLLPPLETAVLTHTDSNGKTLESWRNQGIELPFIKLGRAVRYRLSDVLAYRARAFSSSREANTRDRRILKGGSNETDQ